MTPRVVVVDATPFVRRAVRTALEGAGILLVAELDGTVSLPAVSAHLGPDVVLLDAQIDPDMRCVRAILDADPNVAVIILAHDHDPQLALNALRAGACGFIPKETDPERLPAIVRGAVAGQSAFPRTLARQLFAELCRAERRQATVPASDASMSRREFEVLECLADGFSDRAIGARLMVSDVTVRRHIASAMRKLNVTDRGEAVARYVGGGRAVNAAGTISDRA